MKFADFNISREAEGTVQTGIVGTMENLPPEAIKGEGQENLSFSWDMWAMGIIFHMLCVFRNDSNFFQKFNSLKFNLKIGTFLLNIFQPSKGTHSLRTAPFRR